MGEIEPADDAHAGFASLLPVQAARNLLLNCFRIPGVSFRQSRRASG